MSVWYNDPKENDKQNCMLFSTYTWTGEPRVEIEESGSNSFVSLQILYLYNFSRLAAYVDSKTSRIEAW